MTKIEKFIKTVKTFKIMTIQNNNIKTSYYKNIGVRYMFQLNNINNMAIAMINIIYRLYNIISKSLKLLYNFLYC